MDRFEVTGLEVDAMFHDSYPNECPTLTIDLSDHPEILSASDVERMFNVNPFDMD